MVGDDLSNERINGTLHSQAGPTRPTYMYQLPFLDLYLGDCDRDWQNIAERHGDKP